MKKSNYKMVVLKIEPYIQMVRCKNNHRSFYSKVCPFCGHVGNRPFRYNSVLRVGKSYCCGISFKDISWMKLILIDRDRYDIELILNDKLMSHDRRAELVDKYIKDKMSIEQGGFEKSDEEELGLPF